MTALFAISMNAQDIPAEEPAGNGQKMNIVKMNLPALVFNNYSFQYERMLGKRFSAAIGFSTRPMSNIPFNEKIADAISDEEDDDVKDIVEKTKIGSMTITPEIRWYLGKGYGRGFYLAPYYRYSKFQTEDVYVNYTDDTNNEQEIKLSGDITASSFGLMLGAQWMLSKHISLDWWIVGGHFGTSKGDVVGVSSRALSPNEQQQIREELEDIELPSGDMDVTVTANRATVKLDDPWAGLRAGLSLGFRF